MRDLHIKYKILWFCVDTHHRQRYFFNCGCKQTVTNSGVTLPPAWGRNSHSHGNSSNLFPVFATDCVCPPAGSPQAGVEEFFTDFAEFERNT